MEPRIPINLQIAFNKERKRICMKLTFSTCITYYVYESELIPSDRIMKRTDINEIYVHCMCKFIFSFPNMSLEDKLDLYSNFAINQFKHKLNNYKTNI